MRSESFVWTDEVELLFRVNPPLLLLSSGSHMAIKMEVNNKSNKSVMCMHKVERDVSDSYRNFPLWNPFSNSAVFRDSKRRYRVNEQPKCNRSLLFSPENVVV